jgi:hypothetical protein
MAKGSALAQMGCSEPLPGSLPREALAAVWSLVGIDDDRNRFDRLASHRSIENCESQQEEKAYYKLDGRRYNSPLRNQSETGLLLVGSAPGVLISVPSRDMVDAHFPGCAVKRSGLTRSPIGSGIAPGAPRDTQLHSWLEFFGVGQYADLLAKHDIYHDAAAKLPMLT